MVRKVSSDSRSGKNLALTILLGVFVAVMLIVFVNLLVSYAYEGPQYDEYCTNRFDGVYPIKYGLDTQSCQNCTFSLELQAEVDECYRANGIPVYEYNELGCTRALKACDMCSTIFEAEQKTYNRVTFFIYALIGFALIVFGLFTVTLLLQIVALPAGAFLVIEAAAKNFDDKLFVIVTFGLLIVSALYLALKKLRLGK